MIPTFSEAQLIKMMPSILRDAIAWLEGVWPKLDSNTQQQVIRTLEEGIERLREKG